jgi:hypothetical protein
MVRVISFGAVLTPLHLPLTNDWLDYRVMKMTCTLLLFAALTASIQAQQTPTPQPQIQQPTPNPTTVAASPSIQPSAQPQPVPCPATKPKKPSRPLGVTWHLPNAFEYAFRRESILLDEKTGIRVNGAQIENNVAAEIASKRKHAPPPCQPVATQPATLLPIKAATASAIPAPPSTTATAQPAAPALTPGTAPQVTKPATPQTPATPQVAPPSAPPAQQ